MAKKTPSRTIFVVQDAVSLYYFCESNMRCVPKRLWAREDADLDSQQAHATMIELADFYSIPILPESIKEHQSFLVTERGLFRTVNVRITILLVQAKTDQIQKRRYVVPLSEHRLYQYMDLTEAESSCVNA